MVPKKLLAIILLMTVLLALAAYAINQNQGSKSTQQRPYIQYFEPYSKFLKQNDSGSIAYIISNPTQVGFNGTVSVQFSEPDCFTPVMQEHFSISANSSIPSTNMVFPVNRSCGVTQIITLVLRGEDNTILDTKNIEVYLVPVENHVPSNQVISQIGTDALLIKGENGQEFIINSSQLLEIATCNNGTSTDRGSRMVVVKFTVGSDNKTITSISCD